MYENGKIYMGLAGDKRVELALNMCNRHGLIAGASGTGKTVTMKVMAESFSDAGVPVFLCDVKGDVAGICAPGQSSEGMEKRIDKFGLRDRFVYQGYPTTFWDVYQEGGHAVRATVSDMGPELLSRILGLTAVVCQIAVQKTTIHYEIPMVIGVTILLAVMGLQNNIISRAEGVILLACMVVYMLYLLRLAKRGVVENEELDAYAKQVSFGRLILLVVVGVAAIIFGSHVAVEAASAIARIFGISERFIGLTIVAFGTSLPELVTSVAAARRGNSDIAVGNIVGSNLFNIMFVVGITAVIVPVVYQPTFRVDSIVAVAAAALLLICVYRGRVLKRRHGLLMLACYGGYFAYLLLA